MARFKIKGSRGRNKPKKEMEILAEACHDGVEYQLCYDSYEDKRSGDDNHVLVLRSPNTRMKDKRIGMPYFLAFAEMVDAGLKKLADLGEIDLGEEDNDDMDD